MAMSAPGHDTRECSECELHVPIGDSIVLELAGSGHSGLSTRASPSRVPGIIVIRCGLGLRGPGCCGWLCLAACGAGKVADRNNI